MTEFADVVRQEVPTVQDWDDSPVRRWLVATSWARLAQLNPTHPQPAKPDKKETTT